MNHAHALSSPYLCSAQAPGPRHLLLVTPHLSSSPSPPDPWISESIHFTSSHGGLPFFQFPRIHTHSSVTCSSQQQQCGILSDARTAWLHGVVLLQTAVQADVL